MASDLVRTGWKHKRRTNRATKRERNQRLALLQQLKSQPCVDCGQTYAHDSMEFDHVPGRGGKLGAVGSRPSLRAMLEEARKCDVVCANCHRVRTSRRRRDKRVEKRERECWLDGLVEAVEREREARRDVVEVVARQGESV